jgi:hypothetical protein
MFLLLQLAREFMLASHELKIAAVSIVFMDHWINWDTVFMELVLMELVLMGFAIVGCMRLQSPRPRSSAE